MPDRAARAGWWRVLALAMTGVAVAATLVAVAPGRQQAALHVDAGTPAAALPAASAATAALATDFEDWDVTVAPTDGDDQQLWVEFDSPVLGLRTALRVYLPDVYASSAAPLPVAYYLHGTVNIHTFGAGEAAAANGVRVHPALHPGQAGVAAGVHETLDRQRYLVVALDMQNPAWCGYCWWVDGRNGEGVMAETHLYDEVIPLVEHLFRVRRDRGGRAILGMSMGANGALLQAFRHPDRWTFVGALSATYSGFEHPLPPYQEIHATNIWWEYIAGQGYGPPATDEVHYRALEPVNLTPQMVDADVDIVATNGDGCITHQDGRCAGTAPADPTGENLFHFTMGVWSTKLTELGVDHTWVETEGVHNSRLARDMYRTHMIDRLNARFAAGVTDPEQFSYRTVDREFGIWGYDVSIDRPNDEFASLLDAAADGHELTLAGTGTATVTTPPVVAHGGRAARPYEVVITPDGGEPQRLVVETDAAGRLTFPVTLGPPRETDERVDLVRAGLFPSPRTRVTVAPIASGEAA